MPHTPHEAGPELPSGIYERFLTEWLQSRLQVLPEGMGAILTGAHTEETSGILSRYMAGALHQALAQITTPNADQLRVELCNRVLDLISEDNVEPVRADWTLAAGPRLLQEIRPSQVRSYHRPETPLGVNALLTGIRSDPSLASQIKKEIDSADRVDILCSFIKLSGLNLILEDLRDFVERGGRLRVLTTTYTGATDAKALDLLRQLPNTEVRVSYDTKRTRMHAKAYLFGRATGYDTAYIGSSNMSNAALTTGLEWNIKVARQDSVHLWSKLDATFQTHWNDPVFQTLTESGLPQLKAALAAEKTTAPEETSFFDLRPFDFQQEILDRLDAERKVQERQRHLVVAATGTGKTMIAAFDYRQIVRERERQGLPRPTLLYVAHREDILKQSRRAFRAVLRDGDFGELLVGNSTPQEYRHVFASIQSFNSRNLTSFGAGHFEYVVVDEFHHSGSPSYRPLLDTLTPQVLLGLTATPERTDNWDVRVDFGGHVSAEIRLPEAINRGLLCPFQYFGIADEVDYSGLDWKKGGYDSRQLNNLLTGNHVRAAMVVSEVHKKLPDPASVRALGFCVSVAHAQFMAAYFCKAGLKAEAIHAENTSQERAEIQRRLRQRETNFLFSVDLYNEGVDISEVDAVLFLRPTESLTIFLQQLGRGLRKYLDKECLTVLDFIGQSHKKFRYDLRFKALQGGTNAGLKTQIKNDFPYLPAGCSIVLQRQAKEYVLDNISAALQSSKRWLGQLLKDQVEDKGGAVPTYAEFLQYAQIGPEVLYRRGTSFARLCFKAGLGPAVNDPDEEILTKGLHRLRHIDDASWLLRLRKHLRGEVLLRPSVEVENRRLLMLYLSLWGQENLGGTAQANQQRLDQNPCLKAELLQFIELRLEQVQEAPAALQLPYACPLQLHASYSRDELLAALGHWTYLKQQSMREGVLHIESIRTDVFLITLDKNPGHYSPTTMYEDYAISDTLFHWQSQSTTSAGSPTGQRYIAGGQKGQTFLLFVREQKKTNSETQAYAFLGPASYVSHEGDKPMSIIWRLHHKLPAHLLRRTARLAA